MSTSSTTTSSVTGTYCSVGGCNGAQCNASSTAISKRDRPLVSGRLPRPEDFLRDNLAKGARVSGPEDYEQDDTWKRGYIPLPTDLDFGHSIDNFITFQITYPGAKPCPLPSINPDSTAITVKFDSPPPDENYYPSLEGLEGCTSVVIIGENGCWISHFWEVPWFFGTSFQSESYPCPRRV